MKKLFTAFVLTAAMLCFAMGTAFSYDVPEAYMGFSVSDQWYVFSKNMTDDALLNAVGLTADEVNEALFKSDCEYFITNPTEDSEIYVKVKKNDLSYEFYNILETDDQTIKNDLDRILKDGFSVDGFEYNPESVSIVPYSQMKFITVPGTVQFDGKKHGMVFGATFVNGNGISFLLYLNKEAAGEADLKTMSDLAGALSFTVIKEKGESGEAFNTDSKNGEKEKPESALSYIAGGLGGLALVALCLYFIDRIKKSERREDHENRETGKNKKFNQ